MSYINRRRIKKAPLLLSFLLIINILLICIADAAVSLEDNYDTLKTKYPEHVQLFLDAGISEDLLRDFIDELDNELSKRTLTESNFNQQFINAVMSVYLHQDGEFDPIFDVIIDNFAAELSQIISKGTIPANLQGIADVLKDTVLGVEPPPPPPPPPPSGPMGGAIAPPPVVQSGSTFSAPPTEETVMKLTEDGLTLTVPAGASSFDITISFVKVEEKDKPAESTGLLSNELIFKVEAKDSAGSGVSAFNQQLIFSVGYKEGAVPSEGKSNIKMCYYDEKLNAWIALPTEVDEIKRVITAWTKHFTVFAVMNLPEFPELNDIKGHWAEPDIMKIASLKIASGNPDGTYKPDSNISRQEFAKLAVVASGLSPELGAVLAFKDAESIEPWALPYVAAAVKAGIINGYSDNTFKGNLNVTRSEIAVMLSRCIDRAPPLLPVLLFNDVGLIPDWALNGVAKAVDLNIIKGYPDNTFRADFNATRAEAATMIANMLSVK